MLRKLFTLSLMTLSFQLMAHQPVGLWQTIDDKTGKARAVIEIKEDKGILNGTIVKVYKQKGDKGICVNCVGKEKNKPVVGLTILSDMKLSKANLYEGGQILDPKNGTRYRCKINQLDNKTLEVRGFIGMPILGRSQTWHKV